MAQMSAQLAMAEQQAKVEKLKAEAQAILANAQPQPQQVEAPQVDMSESVRAEYEQKIAMMKQAQAVQEKMAKQAFDEAQYELRMNFDAQVAALKEQARQTADLVKKEVDRIKQEAASKAASVENTSNVEIEKAKIEADAQKEIARINAQQAEANKDVLAKIDALQKVIEAKGKEKEAKPEPAPAPAPKDDTTAQGMTAAITALTAVVSQLNQPKPAIKIVRDKDGKITGATPE
jgi:chemosensory pili system protein ChpA (sensor histidine kinase/response regulator)